MHDYAIDSNERLKIALYLAIISILLMLIAQRTLDFLNIILPWWIDGISVFGFYALALWLFDKHIWKWQLIKTIGLVKTPNISGNYEGTLLSSYDDFKNPIPIRVEISQTWTKISIKLTTSASSSRTYVASIITDDKPNILTYQYLSEPKANSPSTMFIHRGTAIAEISNDDTLNGSYYTSRDRKTTGQFELKKTSQK